MQACCVAARPHGTDDGMQDEVKKPPPAHHGEGRFTNPWKSFVEHKFKDFVQCFMFDMKKVVLPPLGQVPLMQQPDWRAILSPPVHDAKNAEDEGVQVTWLGHASFLIQMDGLNIVTDPIFSQRCSAVQWVGPKRFRNPPCKVADLPPVDMVIISHNHYDHLDTNTVKELKAKTRMWYVPLGIKEWLLQTGVPKEQVVELDWWDAAPFRVAAPKPEGNDPQLPDKTADVVCTPCQHFSGRSLSDRCKTLWASWAVIGPRHRLYFAGDTGYRSVPKGMPQEDEEKLPTCPVFKEIGDKYGPFDLACIPIGAYSPRWFMSPVHLNPEDAVEVHRDVRSKQSVAMHWGTFVLTDEPVDEPPKRLAQALERRGLSPNVFRVLSHGETTLFKQQQHQQQQQQKVKLVDEVEDKPAPAQS